jgi:hypothetical protein
MTGRCTSYGGRDSFHGGRSSLLSLFGVQLNFAGYEFREDVRFSYEQLHFSVAGYFGAGKLQYPKFFQNLELVTGG